MKVCKKCNLEYRGSLSKYCLECGTELTIPVNSIEGSE